MTARPEYRIPVARLHELLRLDPETGYLYWRVNRGATPRQALRARLGIRFSLDPARADRPMPGGAYAGERAGYSQEGRVWKIKLDGKMIRAGRVAFALHYGRWPDDDVVHLDGDLNNCAIRNLREAKRPRSNSGERAIYRLKSSRYVGLRYAVRGWIDGRQVHVGFFRTIEEAIAARDAYVRRHGSGVPELDALRDKAPAVRIDRLRDEALWGTSWDGTPLASG